MDCNVLPFGADTLIVFKYGLFAAISIVINLFTQYVSDLIYDDEYHIYISLAVGTFAGLVTKYILDKKYIFNYTTSTFKTDISKFILYSAIGIVTTIIFWGTELLFHYSFDFSHAKYFGGLIGLAIGYFTKYHLDKKFVFKN